MANTAAANSSRLRVPSSASLCDRKKPKSTAPDARRLSGSLRQYRACASTDVRGNIDQQTCVSVATQFTEGRLSSSVISQSPGSARQPEPGSCVKSATQRAPCAMAFAIGRIFRDREFNSRGIASGPPTSCAMVQGRTRGAGQRHECAPGPEPSTFVSVIKSGLIPTHEARHLRCADTALHSHDNKYSRDRQMPALE